MFDFHMHSRVSFDGHDTGRAMAQRRLDAGLREVVHRPSGLRPHRPDGRSDLPHGGLQRRIRPSGASRPDHPAGRGIRPCRDNQAQFRKDLARRPFDFVLGSIHFVDGLDVYFEPFWRGKTVHQVEQRYLEETLACVQVHEDFDVLAHLTYISKPPCHPTHAPLSYDAHREVIDEILRVLAAKGKGLEMNTSGVDRCGDFLPSADIFRRFRELGGEIVTVGSDAHRCNRVGQYTFRACDILKDIFGYVCTFENPAAGFPISCDISAKRPGHLPGRSVSH